jgi:hypothetical protein
MKNIFKSKKPAKKEITVKSLYKLNIIAAVLHAVQGIIVLVLAKSSTLPITTNYLTFNQSTQQLDSATRNIFDINMAYLVVAFFFMSAIAHILIATKYRKKYESDLKLGINKARWVEYSISASTMMVAIALLSGIYDFSSLIMIFSLVAVMNLMGLVMELWNQNLKKPNWLSYIIGCFAGFVPWLVFGIYVIGASAYGSSGVPGFVYGIYVSIFIFFNCFAINMFLQYKKIGPWKNYLYGERVYIILSLVAKSALAWQVFAGTLRP